MSIKVFWANAQQNVILQGFTDPWTIEEHRASLRAIQDMVRSQPHVVHSIADMRQTVKTPAQLMLTFPTAERSLSENTGLLFIVSAPNAVRTIVSTARRFIPKVSEKLHFVDTLDEAYTLIRDYENVQRA